MGKILVVAEKPSVARDIARVLQCKKKGEGFLYGEKYIVCWAIGHLVTLADPEEYDDKYKKWKKETLPILPEQMKLKVIKKTAPQLRILKKLMNSKEVDSLICATDSGREGELIFRYIYEAVNCKKSFQRLWISSMTDIAIKEGFLKLKNSQEYDNLYVSAKCRAEADWLVGMNATRAYTLQYNALLSIGRVQTPTLAIMVQRQKEINDFVPEIYYEVEVTYENFKGIWFDKKETETKIKKLEQAENIIQKVKGKSGIISNIEEEQKKMSPPLLYDLTELQRDCNKKFGFSAQKTLSIAQSLYETKKAITYPRTDSRYLSDDMKSNIQKILKKLREIERYDEYVKQILSLEALPLGKRIIDNDKVTDHHAIIPTDAKINYETLTEEQKKVYNTIVIRFLSVFYEQYIYKITKVITVIEQEHFISKGTTILQQGWTAIYKALDLKKKENKKEETLPELKKGQQVTAKQLKCNKKKTQPPAFYTDSSLLSAMENAGRFVEDEALKEQMKENGLGTPATRAAIIERLLTVGYIERKGKTLIPTEKGMKLIEIVPEQLKSPQTTGKWEKGLCSISKGKMTNEKFMTSIKKYVYFLIEASEHKNENVIFEKETKKGKKKIKKLGVCPLCQKGNILENTKAYYCSEWKNDCKFTIWKNSVEQYGVTLKNSMIEKLLIERKLKSVSITLPQTGEKGKATLLLSPDNSGRLEIMDFNKTNT
ncbi:DNA topoisomerase III [Clostridium sp. MD294]|uniref:DNA topoisomerase III n=1 Tax=Clostridium sp. MD294 TaxID=97138 RepID=UPI0002CA633E|nr:DNA topoisomerase III [Clostridium sp. MD294]NDO45599.1 DNA topoisomerase III [Clostridium sp. MD294]USF30747.1 DNA topoisomerase 3 [Clostridium sp. MD294]